VAAADVVVLLLGQLDLDHLSAELESCRTHVGPVRARQRSTTRICESGMLTPPGSDRLPGCPDQPAAELLGRHGLAPVRARR
jgi:hypothetical protein